MRGERVADAVHRTSRTGGCLGFAGLSMWESDYLGARAEGYSDADLRGALADHGIEIAELDALTRWLPGR